MKVIYILLLSYVNCIHHNYPPPPPPPHLSPPPNSPLTRNVKLKLTQKQTENSSCNCT